MSAQRFEFRQKEKTTLLAMVGVGVLGLILAFATGIGDNQFSRAWSNLLLNSYYFMGISLCGIVFIATHQLGLSGWHNNFRRVPESFGAFVPVAGVLLAIIVLAIIPGDGLHNIYAHWTQHAVHGTKAVLLNKVTWPALCLLFIVLWIVTTRMVRGISRKEDEASPLSVYQNSKYISAVFILVFAVTSSVGSWLFVMSIDPHWYSTLFGWYNFASYMCASQSFLILILLYLKSRDYLPDVNENHIHDIGKYVFGFSVFWAYLWFSQFMLIWYGNIPEDTQWFMKRREWAPYNWLMYVNVIINFGFPLLVLMTRASKRNYKVIGFACVMLIFGHYLDFYIMIMPEPNHIVAGGHGHGHGHDEHGDHHGDEHGSLNDGATVQFASLSDADAASGLLADHHEEAEENEHADEADVHSSEDAGHAEGDNHEDDHSDEAHAGAHMDGHDDHGHGHHAEEAETTYARLGLIELMIFAGFIGGFLFSVFSALEKVNLQPKRNPYIKESIDHHI